MLVSIVKERREAMHGFFGWKYGWTSENDRGVWGWALPGTDRHSGTLTGVSKPPLSGGVFHARDRVLRVATAYFDIMLFCSPILCLFIHFTAHYHIAACVSTATGDCTATLRRPQEHCCAIISTDSSLPPFLSSRKVFITIEIDTKEQDQQPTCSSTSEVCLLRPEDAKTPQRLLLEALGIFEQMLTILDQTDARNACNSTRSLPVSRDCVMALTQSTSMPQPSPRKSSRVSTRA